VKKSVLGLAVILAGCASVQPPAPVSDPASGPMIAPAPPPWEPGSAPLPAPAPAESAAVASLMHVAYADAASGRLANAAASLERALRIEPRNPRLWQQLARVRLMQGDYGQAESMAARSNSWAGGDERLRAENWRLIAQAREARGDAEGARAALEHAGRQR
jgi:tetratricopeptide (TPR) repeat protein